MTDPTLAAIDAAKEDYTRGTSKGRHGLHSGSYKYATVDTILAALDLARAAVEMQAVGDDGLDIVDRLRGNVRIPITDGLGPVTEGGNPDFFERSFPTSKLANEAADEIERLRPLTAAVDNFRESVK
jgi:hypothetical protein